MVEALSFGPAGLLHLLVGIFKAVHIVGVQNGKLKFLSTNNHFLAPFVAPCPGTAPEKPVSRHEKSRSGAERESGYQALTALPGAACVCMSGSVR